MSDLPLMFVTLVLALAALMGCMALLIWCVEKSPSAILIRYANFTESGLSLVVACASAFTIMSR